MNRRDFFKALGVTAAVAGAGIELLPAKTIFLPPRNGWWQPQLRMREVEQYLINNDEIAMRYDVKWGDQQYHIDFAPRPRSELASPALLAHQREIARLALERIEDQHGFRRRDQVILALPKSVPASYV